MRTSRSRYSRFRGAVHLPEQYLARTLSHDLGLCAYLLENYWAAHHWQLGPHVACLLRFAAGPADHNSMLNHFESRHAKSVYAGVVISKEKMMECQQKRGMNTSNGQV